MLKIIASFLLICCLFLSQSKEPYFDKKIWVFWNQPIITAPIFVQLCYQKMKMIARQQNWAITLLNDQNYHNYITDFERFQKNKNKMKHPEWMPQIGDHVRLSILKSNGGVWFDLSTILFDGLKWLEQLQKYPYLLTNSQFQNNVMPDLIAPYLSFYQSKSQKRDQNGKISKFLPGYEAWFIAARKQSPAISAWLQRFQTIFKRDTQTNNLQQIRNDYWTKFIKGDYLNVDKAMQQVIQKKQFELDKNISLIRPRKNANKQYRIIGFHGQYGPFAVYLDIIPNKDLVMTHTVEEIAQQYYVYINFFLKFTNVDRSYYQRKLTTIIQLNKKFQNISKNFNQFLKTKPSLSQCREVVFIVEGSIFASLIKDNEVAAQNNLVIISKQQQKKWHNYCQKLTQQNQFYQNQGDYDLNQQSYSKRYLYKLLNSLVHNKYITPQRRSQIHKYIFGNGMGQFTDVQKIFYWRKIYQEKQFLKEKFNRNLKSTQSQYPQPSLNSTQVRSLPASQSQQPQKKKKFLSEYSFFQRQLLYLKINILADRRNIRVFFQQFQVYAYNIIQASYIIFLALATFNSMIIFFYILFIVLMDRNKLVSIFKGGCNKCLNISWIKQKLCQIIRSIPFEINLVLFRIFFFSFYVYVVMKWYQIAIDGQSQQQQSTILSIIAVQILLRKIVHHWLDQNAWFLPGIKLHQAYRIFLPVYFYYLGSSMVQFAQKKQTYNFGSAFPICFVMPALFQQIEFQAKKIYAKKRDNFKILNKTHQTGIFKWQLVQIWNSQRLSNTQKINYLIQYLLSNMTTVVQITVILILFTLMLVPNLRYVVIEQKYFTKVIVDYVWAIGRTFFFVLVLLYLNDLKHIFRELLTNADRNDSSSKSLKQKSIKQKQQNQGSRSQRQLKSTYKSLEQQNIQNDLQIEPKKVQQITKITYFKVQNNQFVCRCSPRIGYNIIILLLSLAKYVINIYCYYQLIITPFPSMVYYGHEQIWKPKVTPIILLLFINFSLQKIIDLIIFNMKYSNWSIFKFQKQSIQQINQKKKDNSKQYKKKPINKDAQKDNKSPYKRYSFFIILITSLVVFQGARLYLIDKLYLYFKACSDKKFNLRWDYEKKFGQYSQTMIMWTLIGYAFLKVIINYVYNKKFKSMVEKGKKQKKGTNQNLRDLQQSNLKEQVGSNEELELLEEELELTKEEFVANVEDIQQSKVSKQDESLKREQ